MQLLVHVYKKDKTTGFASVYKNVTCTRLVIKNTILAALSQTVKCTCDNLNQIFF